MKIVLSLTILTLFAFNSISAANPKDSLKLRIIQNTDTFLANNASEIKLMAEPFQFVFESPKGKDCDFVFQCDTIGKYYKKAIKNKSLKKAIPWQFGNAFSVAIVQYTTIDSMFLISDQGRQPYVYADSLYNSFHVVDSTVNSYTLTKRIHYFMDVENNRIIPSINKLAGKTCYFVAELEYKPYNSKEYIGKMFGFIIRFED